MHPTHASTASVWQAIADDQHGVVGRGQLMGDLGLTPAQARQNVVNGRWRALLPGVYATFTGPVGPVALVWAAICYAGSGAVASHDTALWLAGLNDEPSRPFHVSVGHSRQVRPQRGLRVHRSAALDRSRASVVHSAARPPRVRIEIAVLDKAMGLSETAAIDLFLRATQRRLTTADRLREALLQRSRHRWRGLLLEVLSEATHGVASPLERHYLRDVERRHRLPQAERNQAEAAPIGGHWYRDVRYRQWRTVVELDGLAAHPVEEAYRDHRRDNWAAVAGEVVLRYSWRDVVGVPCVVSAQVAAVLRSQGWPSRATACGPDCKAGANQSGFG